MSVEFTAGDDIELRTAATTVRLFLPLASVDVLKQLSGCCSMMESWTTYSLPSLSCNSVVPSVSANETLNDEMEELAGNSSENEKN